MLSLSASLRTLGKGGRKTAGGRCEPPPTSPPRFRSLRAGLQLSTGLTTYKMARPASCRIGRGVPVTQVRAVQRPAPLSFQQPGGGSQLKGPPRCDHYGQRVQRIQSAGRAPKEVGKSIVGRKSPGKRNPQTGSKGQGGVPRHRWGHVGADQRGRTVGARWPSVEVRTPPPGRAVHVNGRTHSWYC